jgi:hypothetical protein
MTNINKVNLIPVHFTNEDGESLCTLNVNTNVPIEPLIISLSVALEHLLIRTKECFDYPESVEKEEIKQMAMSLFEHNLLNEQDREKIRVLRDIGGCYLDGLLDCVLYCKNLTLSEIYDTLYEICKNPYTDPDTRKLIERSVKEIFLCSPVRKVFMNLQMVLWDNDLG